MLGNTTPAECSCESNVLLRGIEIRDGDTTDVIRPPFVKTRCSSDANSVKEGCLEACFTAIPTQH